MSRAECYVCKVIHEDPDGSLGALPSTWYNGLKCTRSLQLYPGFAFWCCNCMLHLKEWHEYGAHACCKCKERPWDPAAHAARPSTPLTSHYYLSPYAQSDPWTIVNNTDNPCDFRSVRQKLEHSNSTLALPTPHLFSLEEIIHVTGGFNDEYCCGAGGFGKVYQILPGSLRGIDERLVVKQIVQKNLLSNGFHHGLEEMRLMGACRHPNVLRLVGFSIGKGTTPFGDSFCIVTPLMQNGSLQDWLFPDILGSIRQGGKKLLSWYQRVLVISDVLTGLDYLHSPDPTAFKPRILHGDISPNNILLDENMCARIADMGNSREQRVLSSNITRLHPAGTMIGTPGFQDPYYIFTGELDALADGYAMGICILVTLTGLPPIDQTRKTLLHSLCDVTCEDLMFQLVDTKANWPRKVAIELFQLGLNLTLSNREMRTTVRQTKINLQSTAEKHEKEIGNGLYGDAVQVSGDRDL